MTLRTMVWTDIEELTALERELFADDAWSAATWWSELAGRPRRDYVVEVDDDAEADASHQLLGYAGLDHQGDVADLMTIAVAPGAQGSGLGRRLLDVVVDRARSGGAERLLLEVRADNVAARSLYVAAGFEELTVRRRYYQPGDVDAVVMALTLGERENRAG